MTTTGKNLEPQVDPSAIAAAAHALLQTPDRTHTVLEDDMRRAYKLLAPDLAKIHEMRGKNTDVPYASLFGQTIQEKIAALVFLTRQKLTDVAYGDPAAQEIIDARSDLTLYVDILSRLNLLEAFAILYDFAFGQLQERNAEFWQKVCVYYLHLMARMKSERPRAFDFLKDRPHARRQVEQLIGSTDAGVAALFRALGEEYVAARTRHPGGAADPAVAVSRALSPVQPRRPQRPAARPLLAHSGRGAHPGRDEPQRHRGTGALVRARLPGGDAHGGRVCPGAVAGQRGISICSSAS